MKKQSFIKAAFIACCILLAAGQLTSCSGNKQVAPSDCGRLYLRVNQSWGEYTTIYCDSLNMITASEADVWLNGRKMHVVGKTLRPHFVPCR